jgi:hypothetical protein
MSRFAALSFPDRGLGRSGGFVVPLAAALALLIACGGDSGAGPSGSGGSSGSGGGSGTGGRTGSGGSNASGGGSGSGTGGSAGSGGSAGATLTTYKTCKAAERVGKFDLTVDDDKEQPFSSLTGFASDGVEILQIYKDIATIEGCTIKQPPDQANCNTPCSGGEICGPGGRCMKQPTPHNLGKVTVTGLKRPLELTSVSNIYSNPPSPTLDHPPYNDGSDITLSATGDGGYGPFSIKGVGVNKLEVPKTPIPAESGKPATITWSPPSKPVAASRMHIRFSVNSHGRVDTWLECEVPDTGTYTLSAQLTTELFKYGTSGFPSVDLSRRTSDTAMVPSGCVEFVVQSPVNRPLMVPGIQSCSDDSECQAPKTCADDLACR